MDSEWMTPRKRNAKPERKPEAVRQVSKIGISFEPKPSLMVKDVLTIAESVNEFKTFYQLVKAAAKWGDIEVFDITEWTELLEQRQKAPVYEEVNIMDELVESGNIKRAAYIEPEPEPEPEPRFVLPTRPPCEVCGIYLSHSNPPKDFKGRNLCCLWCSIKKGNDHGDRCERCQVHTTSTEEY
jgi:hypothetical protein